MLHHKAPNSALPGGGSLLTCIPNANLPVNSNPPLPCTFQPKLFEVWLSVLPTLQIRKGLPGILLSSALSSATFQSNLHNKIKLGRGGRDPRVKCSHAKEPTGRKQGLHPLEDKPRNLCINYSSFTPSLACISSSQLDFEAMA